MLNKDKKRTATVKANSECTIGRLNFEKLFDLPARISEDQPLSEKYMNIAASIQCVLEEIILKMIN